MDPERRFGDRGAHGAADARVLGAPRREAPGLCPRSARAGSRPAPGPPLRLPSVDVCVPGVGRKDAEPQAGECGAPPRSGSALAPAPPPSLPGLSPPPPSNQTARFPGSDRVHISAGPRPRLLRGHRRQPTGGAARSAGGAGSPDAGPRPRRARSGGARAVPLPEMSSAPSGVCGEKTWLLMTAVGVARDAPRPPRLRRTALSADSRFIVLTSP